MDSPGTHYIGGEWRIGNGEEFESPSPRGGPAAWRGRIATDAEIDAAVTAAVRAFGPWASLTTAARGEYLKAFAVEVKKRSVELAAAISYEIGKPRWEATTEIAAIAGKLDPTLDASRQRNTGWTRDHAGAVSKTRFLPHGPVAVLGPYNFPGHMPNGHIMPALLAGNTVVFKPSELASGFAQLMTTCWIAAGLPVGVLNLIHGDGRVGDYLCRHTGIRAVFFTGSRGVGQAIYSAVGEAKVCALEMGGNSPLVVWDCDDLDAAVVAAIQSAFVTSGQRCSAARRLIVPCGEFGESFLARLVDVTANLRVGPTDHDPEPYMGPLRTPKMVDRLLATQDQLLRAGGKCLLRSERLPYGPSYVTPGVIDVSTVGQQLDSEVFGPLLQVIRVATFAEALHVANNTAYGLAAGLFTQRPELFEQFRSAIRTGVVNWNQPLTGASGWAPFGGLKASGNHRPSGYLAADYCVYATASLESERVTLPSTLPVGLSLPVAEAQPMSDNA